jgi:hypothetical protein
MAAVTPNAQIVAIVASSRKPLASSLETDTGGEGDGAPDGSAAAKTMVDTSGPARSHGASASNGTTGSRANHGRRRWRRVDSISISQVWRDRKCRRGA